MSELITFVLSVATSFTAAIMAFMNPVTRWQQVTSRLLPFAHACRGLSPIAHAYLSSLSAITSVKGARQPDSFITISV